MFKGPKVFKIHLTKGALRVAVVLEASYVRAKADYTVVKSPVHHRAS